MSSFKPEEETCPYCQSRGNCHRHAYYFRHLVWFDGNSQITFSLRILRVKCSGCGHTHAVLPDVIIPYVSYGIQIILDALHEYFSKSASACSICRKYDISEVLLYRWVRLFKRDKRLHLGLLEDSQSSPFQFMCNILNGDFSDFSVEFILMTARSFLQSHKNPAIYRQTVF